MPSISQLNVYPIKSCAGIARDSVRLTPYGLEHDRNWMVVDAQGRFVTQRTHPRMALIRPALDDGELTVAAPEMAALKLALDPAAQVPQGGVETGHGAAEIGAGELVLALANRRDELVHGEGIFADGPARHLPVEDGRGDIGIIGRELTPALAAILARRADEADVLGREAFEPGDLHRFRYPFREHRPAGPRAASAQEGA